MENQKVQAALASAEREAEILKQEFHEREEVWKDKTTTLQQQIASMEETIQMARDKENVMSARVRILLLQGLHLFFDVDQSGDLTGQEIRDMAKARHSPDPDPDPVLIPISSSIVIGRRAMGHQWTVTDEFIQSMQDDFGKIDPEGFSRAMLDTAPSDEVQPQSYKPIASRFAEPDPGWRWASLISFKK